MVSPTAFCNEDFYFLVSFVNKLLKKTIDIFLLQFSKSNLSLLIGLTKKAEETAKNEQMPPNGIEPLTSGLQDQRSTSKLRWPCPQRSIRSLYCHSALFLTLCKQTRLFRLQLH